MKKVLILISSVILLASCDIMSQEERAIRDWLNGKLTDMAEHISKVEIVSTDSVLSLAPMDVMYNDCILRQPLQYGDSVYAQFGAYLYHVRLARAQVMEGKKKDKKFIEEHRLDWRKIHKLNVTGEKGKVLDNVEVIIDTDGSPYLTGREYDLDIELFDAKFNTVAIIGRYNNW